MVHLRGSTSLRPFRRSDVCAGVSRPGRTCHRANSARSPPARPGQWALLRHRGPLNPGRPASGAPSTGPAVWPGTDCRRTSVTPMLPTNLLNGHVNNSIELLRIPRLATLGESPLGFRGGEPGWLAMRLATEPVLVYLQQVDHDGLVLTVLLLQFAPLVQVRREPLARYPAPYTTLLGSLRRCGVPFS